MQIHALPPELFGEKLARHFLPTTPPPARMMAARGLVPLSPVELVATLYQLSFDAEAGIADSAKKTLADAPDDLLVPATGVPHHPFVLHRLSEVGRRRPKLLEAVLRNPNTDDATFIEVARACDESISELIAQNEVRVLRCPRIIESLYMNEHARQSTIDRLLDLAKRNKVSFTEIPVLQDLLEDTRYDTAAEAKDAAAKDQRFKEQLEKSKREEAEEAARLAHLSEEEQMRLKEAANEADDDDAPESDAKKNSKNKQAEIANMSISEKIRLATLGSGSDRDLLIKDGNRLVHMAAVTSPKAQLKDIVGWSSNKGLPDNVISYIANHPRYRRMYRIVANLSCNPKTPFAIATKLVPGLHTKDLALLTKNRNAHPMVRRFAKAQLDARERGR